MIAFGPSSLVKQRRGLNVPLMIDTQQSQWFLSPRHLQKHWPSLHQDFRLTGNSVLDPVTRFSPNFTNWRDVQTERWSWEYLASRCARLEHQSRNHYRPSVSGFNPENDIFQAFLYIQDCWRNGNLPEVDRVLDEALGLFDRVCELLGTNGGNGYGQGMYMEVVEMARLFTPILAQIDMLGMYQLLESMYKMTGRNDMTLQRMLFALALNQQDEIFNIAVYDFQTRQSFISNHIIQILY